MEPQLYRRIRFWILLALEIPSVLFSILIFGCLIKSREINSQRLHNHTFTAILIIYFCLLTIELPITLSFAYRGNVLPETSSFCSFWIGCNYALLAAGSDLMAFASIERYFLIFHERFIRSLRRLVHYPPIILFILYPVLFYTCMIAPSPCENVYAFEADLCGGACYSLQMVGGTIDWILNGSLPIVVIAIVNVILMIRVTHQKRSMQLTNRWRKIRLMYIQLLSVSVLYCCVWIPYMIVELIQIFVDPTFCREVSQFILNYTLYICPLALPFLCLTGLPTVRHQVMAILHFSLHGGHRNQNQVTPLTVTRMRMEKREMAQDHYGHGGKTSSKL